MIRHIVFFKFKVTTDDRKIAELEQGLGELPASIPEIKGYEFGKNVLPSDRAYDFALVSTFEDLSALDRYKVHPEHQKVLRLISEICDHTRSADIETQ